MVRCPLPAQVENTLHWYRVSGDDLQFDFMSARAVHPLSRFSFLAFGDMGESTIKGRKNPM